MNRKKIAAIIVFGLTMTTCSTPANGQMTQKDVISYTNSYSKQTMIDFFAMQKIKQTQLEAEVEAKARLDANSVLVKKAIKKLGSHVGNTWYVFSGATPSGWDCSGLTLWFYEQVGIELPHRASKQENFGTQTDDPKVGDLVVFKYKKSKSAYHVGIYTGDREMIHAPKKGHLTRSESIYTFAGSYSDVSFFRMIETN